MSTSRATSTTRTATHGAQTASAAAATAATSAAVQAMQEATDERAEWSTAMQNDLPDSSFAFVEDGQKDADGRTLPRTKRHLVYKDADGKPDAAHVRNALARLDQTDIPAEAKASAYKKLAAAAKELGIELSDDSAPERRANQPDAAPDAAAPDAAVAPTPLPHLPPAAAQRMAQVAARQRVADAAEAEITRVTLPATVRVVDAARREFEVCATSEAIDSFGTVFSYEASKDAFQRWLRVGNIREMHAPVAVGRGLELHFDDEARKVAVRGRVSRGADPTWLKIEDGVLQGASIGASNVTWEDRVVAGRRVPVATRYDLVELSLVDNPSNPDAFGVSLIRSAEPNTLLLEGANVVDPDAAPPAAATPLTEAQRAALFPETIPESTLTPSLAPAAEVERALAGGADAAASSAVASAEAAAMTTMVEAAQEHRRSAWRLQQDEINRRRELQAEVTQAGDEAVAAIRPLQRGEDAGAYAAKLANIRGAAESRALLAQKTRLRADAASAASVARTQQPTVAQQSAEAAPVAAPVAAPEVADAPRAATARVDATVSGPAGVPADSGGMRNGAVSGVVQTGAIPADSADPAAELGGRALGAQATTRDEEHEHEHEHVNPDGTRMRHAHPHGHVDADHDHMHTFRNGQPTDSRLTRLVQNGRETDIPAHAITHPVSGTAQQPLHGAESALMTVTPGKVGKRVLPNTEDAEAVDFGVPMLADGRAEGDEDLTLNPADFHEGGHPAGVGALHGVAPAHAGVGAPMASRPAEPTQPAQALRPTVDNPTGGRQGNAAIVETGAARAPRVNAAIVYTEDVPGASAATETGDASAPIDDDTQPGYAEDEGDDSDADDARTPSRPPAPTAIARAADSAEAAAPAAPTTPTSQSAAQEQRVGARLSADSRQAVHGMRDGAMAQLRMAAQHCGCPECAGILAIINGGMLDGWGEHPQSGDEVADTKSDTAMFGELRAVRAEVAGRFATLEARLVERLGEVAAELRTQMGDAQLTLSDHQRSYAAQTQRSVASLVGEQVTRGLTTLTQSFTHEITDQLTRLPDALATRAAATLADTFTGLTESVSAVRESVERIEQQPLTPLVAPVAGLADKRVALAPYAANDPRAGALSPEAEIAYLQQMSASLPATDTALHAQIATRITKLANAPRR